MNVAMLTWVQPWDPETEGYAILVPQDHETLCLIDAEYHALLRLGQPWGRGRLPVAGVGVAGYGVVAVGEN